MSKKVVAKRVFIGVKLDINRGEAWEGVPVSFNNKKEALDYRERVHPSVTKYRVQNVRGAPGDLGIERNAYFTSLNIAQNKAARGVKPNASK